MPARPPGEGTPGETDRHRTLLEINNALISNLTREALFHAIARALRQVVPFERTTMFLHDAEKDVLKLFILESSLPSSYFTVGLEMDPWDSHVGLVFQRQSCESSPPGSVSRARSCVGREPGRIGPERGSRPPASASSPP